MFNDKKTNDQVLERNIIAKSTAINGDISSEGDFRIDGVVEGTIKTTGRVVIGANGTVKGNVECANADIEGTFNGKLLVSNLLFLKATATINGEVHIHKLSVEPGASFNATCSMKSSKGIKELKSNDSSKTEKTA